MLSILYLFAYMDRSAVANASIFGYKTSLGISPTQYTLISSVSALQRDQDTPS
jgi:hypothetical protein